MSFKISLAGDLGSGKSTVGKILSRKLGAEVYSTGTIQRQIATEMGMTTLQLNQYMETHPEIDGKIDDGLRALEHSEKNLIIDSRMAWHFVPSSFSVYMAADPFVSAERILKAGRESEPVQHGRGGGRVHLRPPQERNVPLFPPVRRKYQRP